MEKLYAILNDAAQMVYATHWLWKGLADGLALYIILRLLAYGYREHAYLYQFENRAKTLDNWVRFVAPYMRRFRLERYRAHLALNLGRAGGRKDWDTNHFLASQVIYGAVTFVVSYVLLDIILDMGVMWAVVLSAGAFALPAIKLGDVATSRFKSCNKDLPFFIDYLALAMGAGLDFNQGLEKVVADAPKSPLAEEFRLVLRNMRLGMSRAEALVEMEGRMQSPVLKLFVQTLIQAMELGTDVGHTLSVISETLTQKRFQMAEELAGKISVRMMIPMMLFVMPSVMIILLGPMILSYLTTV